MKSDTSPTPAAARNRVIKTLVSGRYICLRVSPSSMHGWIRNRPPFSSSRSAQKIVGESNLGNDRKSIEPFFPTSATVCRSPMIP
jgi:hypothetical protein